MHVSVMATKGGIIACNGDAFHMVILYIVQAAQAIHYDSVRSRSLRKMNPRGSFG